MDEASIIAQMRSVVGLVTTDVASVRTGRVTPAIVEDLLIVVYGGTQKLRLKELATITVADPQTLVIDPWDKSIIGEIKQGILTSNIGVNPVIDGEIIRISFSPMTSEDRQKYIKLLHTKIENARVMIRQIRAEQMRQIKESFEKKQLSEDEKFNQEKRLQQLTDDFIEQINTIGKKKEEELLQM